MGFLILECGADSDNDSGADSDSVRESTEPSATRQREHDEVSAGQLPGAESTEDWSGWLCRVLRLLHGALILECGADSDNDSGPDSDDVGESTEPSGARLQVCDGGCVGQLLGVEGMEIWGRWPIGRSALIAAGTSPPTFCCAGRFGPIGRAALIAAGTSAPTFCYTQAGLGGCGRR